MVGQDGVGLEKINPLEILLITQKPARGKMPITVHVYAMHMQVYYQFRTRTKLWRSVNYANSDDPDQTASMQPDLGLRCLLMSDHFHDSEPTQLSIPIT